MEFLKHVAKQHFPEYNEEKKRKTFGSEVVETEIRKDMLRKTSHFPTH